MEKKVKNKRWLRTSKQKEAWGILQNRTTNELIFGGGAGGAKSYLGCAWIILSAIAYPETRWLIGRSKLKSLKRTTLRTFFEVCKHWEIKKDIHYIYNAQENIITFYNGTEIFLYDLYNYPSDPNFDELGSLELTGAFVDECNQIVFKAWEVLQTRIRYKLDKYDLIPKILGTCNPSKNWVKTEFYDKDKKNILEKGRAFLQSLATDNGFISKHYIANLKKIRNKALKMRLLKGNWDYDDDPSTLFEFNIITDLYTNEGIDDGKRYISGDIARKGRDKMVIGYWEGWILKEIHVLPYEIKADTEKSAQWIMNFAGKKKVRRSNIVLDEDGVGGGVVDKVKGCVGFVNNASPIKTKEDEEKAKRGLPQNNFGSLKAQCWFETLDRAEQGDIRIECEDVDMKAEINEEFGAIKQKDIDKDSKVNIIGKELIKESIGRSPDFGDMIMMRAIFSLIPNKTPQFF